MSESSQPTAAGTVTFSDLEERRRTDRVEISLPIRVRPYDPKEASFDDVCCTLNASRDGVYYASSCQKYRVGMQLRVTFPYSNLAYSRNVDFLGRVVRIDTLSDGRLGVAVDLQMTIHNPKRVRTF